ncbi:MAG: T9SS type A sorting domain-containing protein [Bacteroidales bacterium]|nr:T9SS type A sorting domain-containing protein [Bacteroidales bacterium]
MTVPFALLALVWILQPTIRYMQNNPVQPKPENLGMLMAAMLDQNQQNMKPIYKTTDGLINLTGTAKDGNGTPLDGQVARLYDGETEIASDIIENGTYLMENILLTGTTLNTDNEFWVKQNAPNPFGASTDINFSLDKNERVQINLYDLQGKHIKTAYNQVMGAGEHTAKIDGLNLSNGIYLYTLRAGDKLVSNKMLHLTGGPESTGAKSGMQLKSTEEKTEFTLKITGDEFITKDTLLQLYGTGTITVPELTVIEKPLITGFVYDLDTKWDEDGNRLVPQGIEGMIAFLGSNPDIQTTTDEEGRFYLRLQELGTDSIFVVGANEADTTYYFWKKPAFNITPDTNYISAFNDTTGIPLFTRMWDASEGQDMLEHLVFVAKVEEKFIGYGTWENTTTRYRDEDLEDPVWGKGIRVFMNRDIAPTEWYADSAWSGLKAAEEGRFKFVEVDNANDALLVMRYDHNVPGQGVNAEAVYDTIGTGGTYLTYYEIRIRGPPGGPVLPEIAPSYIVAHEAMHIAYGTGGNHSPFIEDNFYLDALTRAVQGQPLDGTERERRTVQVYWDLERNPKFLHYFRDNPLMTYSSDDLKAYSSDDLKSSDE